MMLAHCIKNTKEEKQSLIGQRQYCLDVLAAGGLEEWEAREYSNLIVSYDEKIANLNQHLDYLLNQKPW
ncbi:hypothetical protein ABKV83_23055 [Enterobacter asburiae]|uniref:hypothetical protein n=1 Tax=Enterobacter asburiae TaxID=61645 RepID=UPI0032AF5EC2